MKQGAISCNKKIIFDPKLSIFEIIFDQFRSKMTILDIRPWILKVIFDQKLHIFRKLTETGVMCHHRIGW